jgi:c-di-AMP phosphodiesterase-like protein
MIQLCAPAIIYVIFSTTQILIDTLNGLFNAALMKTVVMLMVTFLLQILCTSGLNIISWIIVFIPFILMSVIVTLLLYFFGLNATTGKLNYRHNYTNYPCKNEIKYLIDPNRKKNIRTDSEGNIIIFNPYFNASNNPVYYKSPNIIVPKPIEFPKYNK